MRYYFVFFKVFSWLPFISHKGISRVVTFSYSHCSIFKMLSSLSLRELNYYITFSSLCQVLLKIFFRKFFLSYSTALEQPIYYITFSFVCQPFFQNFFSEIFSHLVNSLWASFNIISLSTWFVKYFFKFFFPELFRFP